MSQAAQKMAHIEFRHAAASFLHSICTGLTEQVIHQRGDPEKCQI